MTSARGRRRSGSTTTRADAGQATVELALVLPVIVMLLAVVAQVGLVVRDAVLVANASREAARAAAVDPDPGAAIDRARASSGLDPGRLAVDLSGRAGRGSLVTATVRYRAHIWVPLVGLVLDGVDLSSSTTMRVER